MILRKLFRLREGAKTVKSTEEELVKPFLDHLEDLRLVLIRIVITIVVAMALAFLFRVQLVQLLVWPLRDVDGDLATNLQSFGVTDAFTISFKLSFYAGLVISFPFILFFIANFIFPALTKKERRYLIPALMVGSGLFLLGVYICFAFLLRPTLQFFIADARNLGWSPNLSVVEYFSFVTQFTLAFGLSFELPVVVLLLVKLGILSYQQMATTRAYAVVAIVFLAAIITPTPDLLTLLSLAAPLLVLYEVCIWLAWAMERHSTKAAILAAEKELRALPEEKNPLYPDDYEAEKSDPPSDASKPWKNDSPNEEDEPEK